jgi:hypothetical protein
MGRIGSVLINVCLILCISLDTLVPRFCNNSDQCDYFMDLLNNQSALINICILTSFPLKLIDEYLQISNVISSHATQKQSKPCENSATNSSSKYLLLEKKTAIQQSFSRYFDSVQQLVSLLTIQIIHLQSDNLDIDTCLFQCTTLLLLFALLPRSDMCKDDIKIFRLNKSPNPIWNSRSGVFCEHRESRRLS